MGQFLLYFFNVILKNMAKFKIKVTKKFLIIIISVVVILFAWAGLTKAGYIENYFGVEILCSDDDSVIDLNAALKPAIYLYPETPSKPNTNPVIDLNVALKPVIYLYPETPSKVEVKLNYAGELIVDYPDYDYSLNGWKVFAYPDGKIINEADNKEYSYLFWEGRFTNYINYDLSSGFVVKGSETKIFLQNTLEKIGLTPREYNEFIVFWYPRMKDNEYNLIKFAGEEYTKTAPLTISPEPDSVLRVFMVYKPLDNLINIKPQEIRPFTRKGFAVVEWGGAEIK